jgi:hypothetical protein
VLRLRPIDAKGLDADSLMTQIRTRLDDDQPEAALVRLDISNVDQDAWDQLDHEDHEELGNLRSRVLQCDIRLDFVYPDVEQSAEAFQETTVAEQWRGYVEQMVPEEHIMRSRGWERISAAQQEEQGQLADVGLA